MSLVKFSLSFVFAAALAASAGAQDAAPPVPKMVSSASGKVAADCKPADRDAAAAAPAYPGLELDPSWPREAYLLTDSVVLGAQFQLLRQFRAACWTLRMDGQPAIMMPAANAHLRKYAKLPPVAILAIGYNSLWEKDRKNFERWSAKFDAEADQLLKTLAERGVKKVIWVKLREISAENIPMKHPDARMQLKQYSFYFPYVNERLLALRARHPGLALADWKSVGNGLGFTYDAIHLNPLGAATMTNEIQRAVGIVPPPEPAAAPKTVVKPPERRAATGAVGR
jgi:hypothetical protein